MLVIKKRRIEFESKRNQSGDRLSGWMVREEEKESFEEDGTKHLENTD